MSQGFKKYLWSLRAKAIEFERKDINGKEATGFWTKFARRIVCATLSVILILFMPCGFGSSFIELSATILSIFVGLFITALIFAFDKFYSPSIGKNPNASKKVKETQSYNYYKQFTYLIGFNIVISVFVLVLLLVNSIFLDGLAIDVTKYRFIFENLDFNAIVNFFIIFSVLLFRFMIVFNLLTIFYVTIFMVSSMVEFMASKVDFEKNTNDN